jgi:DNA-binding MarR family transcriptional regulator
MREFRTPSTLPTRLGAVLRRIEGFYVEAGGDGIHLPSLDLWANLLRVIDEQGVDSRALPELLRLSKRAVKTRLATAIRRGFVEQHKIERGLTHVRLSPHGSRVAAQWKTLQEAAENRWKTAFEAARGARQDAARVEKLRASLAGVVAALPLEHPHYPAGYGPADARITGGRGQDWKPVPRGSGDTVSHLSISALVAQLLVAFAMRYEERSPVALSLSANVIRQIPAEGRPLRELGHSVGVSALIRHGLLRVTRQGSKEIVHLTPSGLEVQRAYEERVHAVETAWRAELGEERIAALRRGLEELQSAFG